VKNAECPKNSFKRLYTLKGWLVLVEKASFSKEFRSEFHSGGGGKGGPEPLEKKKDEISGSKREDRLSDPFFELVQNTRLVRFSYLLRLCNFCKAPRDMQKFPQKCQKIAGC